MLASPDSRGGDSLTRTTLQVQFDPPVLEIERLVKALKRVSGVLLAELGDGGNRIVVAHDAAVPAASLIAAAVSAGVPARIVGGARQRPAQDVNAAPLSQGTLRRALTIAASLFAALAVGQMLFPHFAVNRLGLPIVLASVWVILIVRALVGRRR